MNKFRNNLHAAFFDPKGFSESGYVEGELYNSHTWNGDGFDGGSIDEVVITPSQKEEQKKAEEQKEESIKEAEGQVSQETGKLKTDVLQSTVRRNNESLASSVEKREDEITDKELMKQLKQLAKNKKIDFPWTDNEWKCSRAEKKLATSSAKVFEQVLEQGKLRDLINKCKSQSGDLTDEIAENWKKELGINSKTKDIQNFYKAYNEYQNAQSEYQHLKNLMGFFCESNFENLEGVKEALKTRSTKISKQEIKDASKMLYQEGWVRDADGKEQYVIIDNKTGKEIENKPKDWEQRASFEIIKRRLGSENITEEKMLNLLGDFNLDGEVNSGDVGYKTGSQFVDVFRRSIATLQLENKSFNSDVAVKNIVEYANKYGMDMGNISTIQDLYNWMTDDKNGYENTKKFQNFIKNLPVEISDVIKNGKDAGADSLNNLVSAVNLEKKEAEALKVVAKEKADEIINAGESKLKEYIKNDNQRASITQSLRDQLPQMLIDEAVKQKNAGVAAGASLPLDEIVKGMSAGFNVGLGGDGEPKFGLFLGWGKGFDISDTVKLRTAVSTGVKLLFIPCEAASIDLSKDINKGSRDKTLDATGEKRISLGGNIAVTGPIFSYGVTAGYENNKDTGIEKQAQNINKVVKKQAKEWVNALKTAENKEFVLKEALKTEFPNSSEEELKSATANLMLIINQFKIDERSTEQDFDTYAQVIADVYAEQYRNTKIAGIVDNKRKISGGKVGIQFIAGCVPVLTLVARFTKYRNARTNESEHSKYARIDAQVNGQGNKLITLDGGNWLGASEIAQFNDMLQRYGVKSQLRLEGAGDKVPGRIVVPSTIVDGVNVRISPSMKGYVKKESDGSYSFPANAVYRILQETGGNQRSLTLNIGSDKSASDDILLSDITKMDELIGDSEIKGEKKWEVTGTIDVKPGYESELLKDLFTSEVVNGLKRIDSSNRGKFSVFMKTKRDAVKNFDEMVNALKDVLGEDQKYSAIVEKLNSSETLMEDKQLIIDRIMAISAEANVHNESGLKQNLRQRGEYYKRESMRGPNGQSIFDKLSVNRDEFVSGLENYNSEFKSNLLGATAFYNRNNSAKGLALTGLGATNVLGGKTQELSGEDESKAKEWFLGGNDVPGVLSKEKSPAEFANVKRALESKISEGVELSDENLQDLLKGNTVEVSLDNSKKINISLDVKYVFYLMGECANESVGMELGNIQIQEQGLVDDYSKGKMYLNNSDGTNTVDVDRTDRAVGVAVNLGNNGGGNEEENSEVKTGDATQGGKMPNTETNTNGNPDNEVNNDIPTAPDEPSTTISGGGAENEV